MRRAGVLFGVVALLSLAGRVAADAPSRALIPMFENPQVRVWKTVLARASGWACTATNTGGSSSR
jgi:hypothetical protein